MEEQEKMKYVISLLCYLMKKEREEMQIPMTVSNKEPFIRIPHDANVNHTDNIYKKNVQMEE